MAISIKGGSPLVVGSTGNPISGTLTGTRQPAIDDCLYIIHCNDFFGLANMPTPTVGGSTTGVIAVTSADGGADNAHIKTYRFKVTATGDLTVSVTETGSADEEKGLIIFVLPGVDTVTPLDGTPAGAFGVPSINPTAPSVPDVANTDSYLICHTNSGGGASAGTYLPPSGMNEVYDQLVGSGMSMSGAIQQLSASGATGTKAFTALSAGWAATSAVFRTAGAASASPRGPRLIIPLNLPRQRPFPPIISRTRLLDLSISATLAGTLPVFTGALVGNQEVTGGFAGTLPVFTGALAGAASVSGSSTGSLPVLSGQLLGDVDTNVRRPQLLIIRPPRSNFGTAVDQFFLLQLPVELPAGSLTGTLPTFTGALVGTVTATGTLAGSLPALTAALVGTEVASGALAGSLPPLIGSLVGAVFGGQLSGTVAPLIGGFSGVASVDGAMADTLPPLAGQLVGSVAGPGVLAGSLPTLAGQFTGGLTTSGSMVAGLPVLVGSLAGLATSSGPLVGIIPSLTAALTGGSSGGGSLLGSLPPLVGALSGEAIITGVAVANLPNFSGSFSGLVFANVLIGTLPPVVGVFGAVATVSGVASGVISSFIGGLTGSATVIGGLNGMLASYTGVMSGSLIEPTGPLAGSLAGMLGALLGTSEANELGLLRWVLPRFYGGRRGGWSNGDWELWIQRRNTLMFIDADPSEIALIPQQQTRLPSGGLHFTDLPARAVQTFRLIPMSHTEHPIASTTTSVSGSAGVQRRHDFTLLGTWDSTMAIRDTWEDEEGNRWVIDALVPYNSYERKALILKYVER